MEGNTKVLDEKLNLLGLGFPRMVFHMLLAFCINLMNSKCCIQHTYSGRQKSQDHVGLDLQFIKNNIACVLHDILNNCYRLEKNQSNDFILLIDLLRDPRAFHE